MSDFTPGPWAIDHETRAILGGPERVGLGRTIICQVGNLNNPAILADARLISAGPCLLSALTRLLAAKDEKDARGEMARYRELKEGAWEAAREVVGRVKGGQSL